VYQDHDLAKVRVAGSNPVVRSKSAALFGAADSCFCPRCPRACPRVLQTIDFDRGCFACALGGPDRQTLFVVAAEWNGPEQMFAGPRTGQLLAVEAPAPGAGWP
jgi:hypothetical protein